MNEIIGIFMVMIVLGIPIAYADSDRDSKLEFAGTLEETLGHFWALELNLDENNSKLALVHATHPISELYDTMSTHLENNSNFDEKLEQTLLELKNKASTNVSREEAQTAIDEAKEIIREARGIVVGQELSDESEFKMQLINGLLETSKVEYNEAVVNGVIEEMAEFQDGTAFIWQSQQIFSTFENELDPIDAERINEYYSQVWSDFDSRAEPTDVINSIDLIIQEFEELSGIQSIVSDHELEYLASLAPLKQLKEGVEPNEVQCKITHSLVFKSSGQPACVKHSSVQKLISMGWSQ
jgi:hypothetical protein